MVKVPQRLLNRQVVPPQGKDVASSSTDIRPDTAAELSVAGVNADRRGVSGHGAAEVEDRIELDAAIDAALAASDVDPVTRAHLDEARAAIGAAERRRRLDSFRGQNLAEALFRFAMPTLRHPDVLHAERHRAILEHLAVQLARLPEDKTVREGAAAIRRELHSLAMLRQGRNSLIEG
jgi:hypothetical protein